MFLRDMPDLHSNMRRLTSTQTKALTDPDNEPDFYRINDLHPLPPADVVCQRTSPAEDEIATLNKQRNLLLDTHGRGGRPSLPPACMSSSSAGPPDLHQSHPPAGVLGGVGTNGLLDKYDFGLAPFALSDMNDIHHTATSAARQFMGLVPSDLSGMNDIQRQHAAISAARQSMGLAPSALSDMNDIQRQHAAISAARQSMEIKLERLREHEERLLRLTVMRFFTSSTLPSLGRLSGAQSFGTALAQPLDVSAIESVTDRNQVRGRTSLSPELSSQGARSLQSPPSPQP
jgi:hypothetical protein